MQWRAGMLAMLAGAAVLSSSAVAEEIESVAPIQLHNSLKQDRDPDASPAGTVHAESDSVDDSEAETVSSTSGSRKQSGSAANDASRRHFDLTLSSSSNREADHFEIVSKDDVQAPRILFEAMETKNSWSFAQWDAPLAEMRNLITNQQLEIEGNVLVGVSFPAHSDVRKISFEANQKFLLEPTLVLENESLKGLKKLMIVDIRNFNVSFTNPNWLPRAANLTKLTIDGSVVTGFDLSEDVTLGDVLFRETTMDSFPNALLNLEKPLAALIIEACTFSEPIKLEKSELESLREIPHVVLTKTMVPDTTASDCESEEDFQGVTICIQKPRDSVQPMLNKSKSNEKSGPPPISSADDSPTNGNRTSGTSVATIVGIICAIAGIMGIAAFVVVSRRKQKQQQEHGFGQSLTFTDKNAVFLGDGMSSAGGSVGGSIGGPLSIVMGTSGASSVASGYNLGKEKVSKDIKLGVNGLWRAEYRHEPVVALKLTLSALESEGKDINTIACAFINMQHPNIVRFLGTSEIGVDEVLLVVEQMDRGSLQSVLAASQTAELTWEKRLEMYLQIVSGLAFLHSSNPSFVSRDLSTRSVLCDDELNCKLDVFDCVESLRDFQAPLVTYGLGEIASRAPEVLCGGPMTREAEVYALGVIFCELSRGAPLFEDILNEKGPALGDLYIAQEVKAERLKPEPAADAPEDFRTIIASCVAHDPSERPTLPEIIRWLRARYSLS